MKTDQSIHLEQILSTAKKAAHAAGDIMLKHFTRASVSRKTSNNLVTNADLESEAAIVSIIRQAFTDHALFGEEGSYVRDFSVPDLWVIDPLDGTNNYAHGIPMSSVSIAYAQHGSVQVGVVFDPFRKELFSAVRGEGACVNGEAISVSTVSALADAMIVTGCGYDRGAIMNKTLSTAHRMLLANVQGIRRTGSAAIDLSWVACGRFDAYYEYQLSPWDYAAGGLIVTEAGGKCFGPDGADCTLESNGIIAVNPLICDEFRGIVIAE